MKKEYTKQIKHGTEATDQISAVWPDGHEAMIDNVPTSAGQGQGQGQVARKSKKRPAKACASSSEWSVNPQGERMQILEQQIGMASTC